MFDIDQNTPKSAEAIRVRDAGLVTGMVGTILALVSLCWQALDGAWPTACALMYIGMLAAFEYIGDRAAPAAPVKRS